MPLDRIKEKIPQREPFLFVDKIIDQQVGSIICEVTFDERHDFLSGHFPGNPIVPGVILSEALFQTGALLMSEGEGSKLPVVTRIQNAKFRDMVKPNQRVTLNVELIEQISNAFYLKGKVIVNDKVALTMNFSCAHV